MTGPFVLHADPASASALASLDALALRPTGLLSVPVPMSWGREEWHGSTQEGVGQAGLMVGGERRSLAEVVRARPELLGRWSRALFGDDVPVFSKFLRTNFAPFVHFGFAIPVERAELLGWLRTEQALMRALFALLAIHAPEQSAEFMGHYSAWAMNQSLGAPEGGGRVERWASVALDETLLAAATPFLRPGTPAVRLRTLLGEVRLNRARYSATVNLVDLRDELGNMLLSPAGVPHAINGLSEQTHPRDAAFGPLTRLFGTLDALLRRQASDDELAAAIEAAGLDAARRTNRHPPKNEAWLPIEMNGALVLVEPQQASTVTYSFADFTTPFAWNEARGGFSFRKGEPRQGLSDAELATFVDALELEPLAPSSARRQPVPVDVGVGAHAAALSRLVDEPRSWPYFTAYRLRLGAGGTFTAHVPEGAFQNVLVLQGTAVLHHPACPGPLVLTPDQQPSAIVWATVRGPYTVEARPDAGADVLFMSVPVPHRLTPAGLPVDAAAR
jgi:hypothetical protein